MKEVTVKLTQDEIYRITGNLAHYKSRYETNDDDIIKKLYKALDELYDKD